MRVEEYRNEVARQMSEGDFQARVVEMARGYHWLVYHTHDSRRSNPGFPDLVLTRAPASAVYRELIDIVSGGAGRYKTPWRKQIRYLLNAWEPGGESRLIIAELKREGKKPEPEQDFWLRCLGLVQGIEVYLWRPSDLDDIATILV